MSGFEHVTEFFRNHILPPRPYFIATVLAVLAVDFGIRGAISYVTSDAASQGFRTWASTPGFGGLAAVVAASIAALSLRAQLRHNKRIDRERAWWQNFEWAVERALSIGENSSANPAEVAAAMIQPLLDHNPTNLQVIACRGVMSVLFAPEPRKAGEVLVQTFHDEEKASEQPGTNDGDVTERSSVSEPAVEPEHEDSETPDNSPSAARLGARLRDEQLENWWLANAGRDEYSSRANSLARQLLESYVERTRGTSAASPEAERYLYREKAEVALKEIATAYRWHLRRGNEEDLIHPDMPVPDYVVVNQDSAYVNVMLLDVSRPQPSIAKLHRLMMRSKKTSEPWLILSKKMRAELSGDTFSWVKTNDFSDPDRARIENEISRLLRSSLPFD